MNILSPVSSLMTAKLKTLSPGDTLAVAKEIFDNNNIHHLPVVRFKEIVGMVSKTDVLQFLHGIAKTHEDSISEKARLTAYRVEEIMTKGLAKVSPDDSIRTVLEVFKVNRFHALPVVENDELVGIITTFDIIKKLSETEVSLDDYKTA